MKDNKILIYEIGVGSLSTCRTLNYWGDNNYECYLYEPNIFLFNDIKNSCENFNNVHVFNLAISNVSGQIKMILHGDCTFIDGIKSPIVQHGTDYLARKSENSVFVDSKKITEIDNGFIDVLLLDMEGSEWFAIENLVSRPRQINVELEVADPPYYINPNKEKILEWMDKNNYKMIESRLNGSDWVFIKS